MIRRPPRSTLFPYTDALPIFRLRYPKILRHQDRGRAGSYGPSVKGRGCAPPPVRPWPPHRILAAPTGLLSLRSLRGSCAGSATIWGRARGGRAVLGAGSPPPAAGTPLRPRD